MAAALPPLLDKWQTIIGETPDKVEIRRMKTKWGSCTQPSRSIRLNLELVTRSLHCVEYVLVHLLERTHNAKFNAIMDQYMPNRRSIRDELNDSQLSYAIWGPVRSNDVD